MRFSSQNSNSPSSESRFRERNAIQDPDIDFLDRAHFEEIYEDKKERRHRSRERKTFCNSKGNDHSSLHRHVPKTTFDCSLRNSVPAHGFSFDLEYKHASSKKVNRSPIKAKKEVLKEKENEKAPTNLIARLMGLDPMPPTLAKQQKERINSSQKTPYLGTHNKYSAKEVEYIHTSNSKYQEFKDVYEIMERPMFEQHEDELLQKETVSVESNKFNDALKDIDYDQNNYYEYNSTLKKHFRDYKRDLKSSPPYPHANQITILKPSSKYDSEVRDKSDRKPGQSMKEHRCSVPYKSSPPYRGMTNAQCQSAEIVVLKPSLEKAWNFKVVAKSNQNIRSEFRRQQFSKSEKLYNDVDDVHHKQLREIARDVTKQLRTATINSGKMTRSETLDFGHHLNGFSDNLGASSYYPTESKVSREARKHLSQRYKKVQQNQANGIDGKGISTLEDLLVSDMEKSRTILNHSKEIFKERTPQTLSMSKSLPASFPICEKYKQNKRNRLAVSDSISHHGGVVDTNTKNFSIQSLRMKCPNSNAQLYSCGEDNEMYEKEIYVSSEELHSRVHSRQHSKENCMDDDRHTEQFKDLGGKVYDRETIATEVRLDQIKEVDCNEVTHTCQYDLSEPASSVCIKEDQPTPVSVLEPTSFEEDNSSPECFEKISANLKELRMQLRLLKLESADTDDECELVISSEEDGGSECNFELNRSGSMLEAFKSDKDRDYSYLHDVVTASNVHPIEDEVFQELEKKYSKLSLWSRSERKLLFDLINSSLFDLRSTKTGKSCAKFDGECIVEEIWQFVVKQKTELTDNTVNKVVLDSGWLVLGEDIDNIARDMEKRLVDDLIEELI